MGNKKVISAKPVLLLPGKYSDKDVEQLRTSSKIWREVDIYTSQLEELLEIRYPDKASREKNRESLLGKFGDNKSAWVYYPWSGVLLHCVGSDELYEIRTNRNKNIVTGDEQAKIHDSVIGVAGMSVGSGIAIGAVYAGIGSSVKIADFDSLETANLNRIREKLASVGQQKADLAAQSIYEIDPFMDVRVFDKGIDEDNIDKFFTAPNLDIVVDEIDDFKMKVRLRVKAKQYKIPLLMFTSLGDNILIDVERYDESPDLEIFNGAIGDVADEILGNQSITADDIRRYAVQTVGKQYIPKRALDSLPEIGRSLVGRPQLFSTVTVDSGLATYLIREILLGSKLESGRYYIKFSELVS